MDNVLRVNMDGNDVDIVVLDIVKLDEYDKKYIIYSLNNDNSDDIYVSILNEDENSFVLETIEDSVELKKVEDYLIELNDGEE